MEERRFHKMRIEFMQLRDVLLGACAKNVRGRETLYTVVLDRREKHVEYDEVTARCRLAL